MKILLVLCSERYVRGARRTPGVKVELITAEQLHTVAADRLAGYDAVVVAASSWEEAHSMAHTIHHPKVRVTNARARKMLSFVQVERAANDDHSALHRAERIWGSAQALTVA